MLRLALPVLGEEGLMLLVGYTDWWLVGHFLPTTEHKAAMGLMAYMMWMLPSLFAAVAIGATALVARFVGAGDRRLADRTANQAVVVGMVLAVAATLIVALCGSSFVYAMQLERKAADLAVIYLTTLLPAIPFIMFEQVGAACLRGAGDTVSGFLAKVMVNVVNISVSTLLVLGPGPLPEMGWQGIAWGTACGHVVGGTILFVLLCRGRAGLHIRWRQLPPDRKLIQRMLRIGGPGGMDVLAVLVCHLIYVAIINSLGTLSAAAHGLGVQIEALAYLPGSAFQVAAATVTGQLLGAGVPQRATRGALLTLALGLAVMSVAALVFFFGGTLLTRFFTGDPQDEAGLLAARLLKIVAFSTPPLAVLQILSGALRGAGDTRVPLLITFVGLIGVRLPLACLLAWQPFTLPGLSWTIWGAGLGVAGAWLAMTSDIVLRAVLVSWRFAAGNWQKVEV